MIDPGQHLAQMRRTAPLVQNITNYVAMNTMANVLLAAGASPAMVHAEEEAAEFARIASALTVNIGTASVPWATAMEQAAAAASDAGKPWVLDPVAVGATAFRRDLGVRLLEHAPVVIRGNASEILALAGSAAVGKGADAADSVAEAEAAARHLAVRQKTIVAVTGQVDFVTDGTRSVRIENGHEMMPRITALGCSLTGLVGAFVVGQNPFNATISALAYFGLAGEIAAREAAGPASLEAALIDTLYRLAPEELTTRARIKPA